MARKRTKKPAKKRSVWLLLFSLIRRNHTATMERLDDIEAHQEALAIACTMPTALPAPAPKLLTHEANNGANT